MYLHGGGEDGEDVAGHDGEEGHEHLEGEAEGVERRRDVGRDGQRDEHGEELAKAAGGPEHGLDETANVAVRVALIPCWDGRCGYSDSGAEALDGDLRGQ